VLGRQELHSSAILDILVTISGANDNPTSLLKAQCLIYIADSQNIWNRTNTKRILKEFLICS
jgi:hypothetical protein